MSISKKIPLVITAVFFFISVIPCGSCYASDDGPEYGDAIVVASISDARTLVPILATDSASSEICGMIFNGLVKYDKELNITGDLAESWEILNGGRVIIFHLRKGVKWHDGKPFTSKDVEFTYKKLIDPNVKTPYSSDFSRVEKLIPLDDYTVKIVYGEPFSPALSSWGMMIMPEHILGREDLNVTAFGRQPVGTGPYKFKSWKTQEKIELVSNREYFEGRPYIDRYIYRIIPDESTIFLELQTRGADLASLTPLEYTRQTGTTFFKSNYNKFRYPGFGYTYIGYNLSDPKFKDVKVRKAIDSAINKEEIIRTIFFGLAEVTTGPFMIGSWAYNEQVKAAPYDPGKARALLLEAGWQDTDRDGWLEKNGEEFEFTLLVNQGNSERARCAEMIQRYLKTSGIRMKIRVLEWSALINEYVGKRRFEAVLMGWFLPRDPDNYNIWHSGKTRPGEFNFVGYANTEVDELLEKGRRSFDQNERAAVYKKIHRLIFEDQPYLFLYSADSLPVVNSRFRNVESSPIGIGYNFTKWYVPKAEQRYKVAVQSY